MIGDEEEEELDHYTNFVDSTTVLRLQWPPSKFSPILGLSPIKVWMRRMKEERRRLLLQRGKRLLRRKMYEQQKASIT